MKIVASIAVALLACLFREGQAGKVQHTLNTYRVAKFRELAASSSIDANLEMANASLTHLANAVNGLLKEPQTDELRTATDITKWMVMRTKRLGFRITGTLTKLVDPDCKTPPAELFQQCADVNTDVKKFRYLESKEIVRGIKEDLGCKQAKRLKETIRQGCDMVFKIADEVSRIGVMVLDKGVFTELKSMVEALNQKTKEFYHAIEAFVKVVAKNSAWDEKGNKSLKESCHKEESKSRSKWY